MVKLKNFFEPRKIAVIGVSRNPDKVGHVIFKNIIDGGFETVTSPVPVENFGTCLRTIFENGEVLVNDTLADIRERMC